MAQNRGERPPVDLRSLPVEAYEPGRILVKLEDSHASKAVDLSMPVDKNGLPLTGIAEADSLGRRLGLTGARSMLQPLYEASPASEKYRQRHRDWGFHLWYELILPAETDIVDAVMQYKRMEGIRHAEPAYRIELIAPEGLGHGTQDEPDEQGGRQRGDARSDGRDPESPEGEKGQWIPDDPDFSLQWHYHNTGQSGGTAGADISLPDAWEIEKGNSAVIVAIIDDGIDYHHEDLAGNMWDGIGFNFTSTGPEIIPDGHHGTHVGGTVAAVSNNGTGVSGVAGGSGINDGVRLMSLQVFGSEDNAGFDLAPIYAADNGAAISQNSWGYTNPFAYNLSVLDAIDYFNENGGGSVMQNGLTIFAAGNDDSILDRYPARYSGTMAVASTDRNDVRSSFSNYGNWVEISAPGTSVRSTRNNNTYGLKSGTSMACPHVSGVAALILSHAPGHFNADQLRYILTSTADDHYDANPGYIGLLGSGRLNAHAALLYTQQLMENPRNFQAEGASPTKVSLSWESNAKGDDVLLAWSADGIFGLPQDGVTFSAGDFIDGGGMVLYAGSDTEFLHTEREFNTGYHYRIWSLRSDGSYSIGIQDKAYTLCSPAPMSLPFYEGFEKKDGQFRCWLSLLHHPHYGDPDFDEVEHTWFVTSASEDDEYSSLFVRTGNHSARTHWPPLRYDNEQKLLVSPEIQLPVGTSADLRFWMRYENAHGFVTLFSVQVYSEGEWSAPLLNLDGSSPSNLFEEEVVIDLGAYYSGQTIQLAFVYQYNNGWDLAIDDIRIAASADAAQDGPWSDPATWGGRYRGGTPGKEAVVTIDQDVQVDVDAEVFGLTIKEDGQLTIQRGQSLLVETELLIENDGQLILEPGAALSVKGNLLNQAGPEALVLRADETGSASLIHDHPGVAASAERYYYAGEPYTWQGVSTAMHGQQAGDLNGGNQRIFAWHEMSQSWVGPGNDTHFPTWHDANDGSDELIPARGYFWAHHSDTSTPGTHTFTGSLISGSQSVPVTAYAHPDDLHRGFNLLGNPFSASLDWDHPTGWTHRGTLLVPAEEPGTWKYWMYNPADGNYGAYATALPGGKGTLGVNRYIPPRHAFWVEAQSTGTLGIHRDLMAHTTHSWEEGEKGSSSDRLLAGSAGHIARTTDVAEPRSLYLRTGATEGNFSDELLLVYGGGAGGGLVRRLQGMETKAPAIYVQVDSEGHSIARLSEDLQEAVIIGFRAGQTAFHHLSARGSLISHLNANGEGGNSGNHTHTVEAWLEDTHTGNWHHLTKDSPYTFFATAGQDDLRFRLHFLPGSEPTAVTEPSQEDGDPKPQAYYHRGMLHLSNPWPESANMSVYDLAGQVLLASTLPARSQLSLPFVQPASLYVVRMSGPKGTVTTKIVTSH